MKPVTVVLPSVVGMCRSLTSVLLCWSVLLRLLLLLLSSTSTRLSQLASIGRMSSRSWPGSHCSERLLCSP